MKNQNEELYQKALEIVKRAMKLNPTIPDEAKQDLINEEIENLIQESEALAISLQD